MFDRRGKKPRLSTHTRLVLVTTALLLIVGFVGVLAIEWNNQTLLGTSLNTKLNSAIFHSVTPRTAGFNTMDMSKLAPATVFLTIVLMFIGGSPGGTAGGIKTSTLGVMFTSVLATLRGREKAEMFHHSVSEETVHRVASIILLSFVVVVTGAFVLLITEKSTLLGTGEAVRFEHVMFESVSAFGTVGLSTGLTGPATQMTVAGKLVITMLMFVGRLGPIALILSVASMKETAAYSYPEDRILVG
jgi:trk system potassium uptake protein TrkH